MLIHYRLKYLEKGDWHWGLGTSGSDRVVGADVSHHASTVEKASYLVRNLANIWDDDTPFTGGSR